MNATDRERLRRCVELAKEALEGGDEPFGSMLVNSEGKVLFEDRNRVAGGDATQHPEFAIARWAAKHMTAEERAEAKVYTSGEHCPMCAAAHAWVGLGTIYYASSSEQLGQWLGDMDVDPPPVATLPINTVAPNVRVIGPAQELAEDIRMLHQRLHGKTDQKSVGTK